MKYAVVTGSSSGIGYSIAKRLVSNGYFVFINGRHSFIPSFQEESYMYIQSDLSSLDGVICLTDKILSKTKMIDVLVLCAGATCRNKMTDISLDDWQYVMNVNVNMPFFTVQKLSPFLSKEGSVLFISSLMGIKPHATSLVYGVSKSAEISLAQNLVKELPGIRVNCVCPGFVDTQWQRDKPDWKKEKIKSKIALNRFAESSEIADICINVIENTYINGSVICIDGGYDMT